MRDAIFLGKTARACGSARKTGVFWGRRNDGAADSFASLQIAFTAIDVATCMRMKISAERVGESEFANGFASPRDRRATEGIAHLNLPYVSNQVRHVRL